MGLREHIAAVLSENERVPAGQPVNKAAGLKRAFYLWESDLRNHLLLAQHPTGFVKSGYGQGLKAAVPWLLVGDRRESDIASRGVYVAYLGRPDSRAMVLTIVHAIRQLDDEFGGDHVQWDAAVGAAADRLRPSHQALTSRGFSLQLRSLQLGPGPPMVRKYERAAMAWKSCATSGGHSAAIKDLLTAGFSPAGNRASTPPCYATH